jgi:hypothetical protein
MAHLDDSRFGSGRKPWRQEPQPLVEAIMKGMGNMPAWTWRHRDLLASWQDEQDRRKREPRSL